ncbi:hypothetical protein LLE95_07330, partial [Pediococcus acidilactici]|nr:hypothetical protein [Pediococcus acidilactici]
RQHPLEKQPSQISECPSKDEKNKLYITLNNGSKNPVFNVFVVNQLANKQTQQNIAYTSNSTIPIGQTEVQVYLQDGYIDDKNKIPYIYFTDTDGEHWKRQRNGRLVHLKKEDTEYDYAKYLQKHGAVLPYSKAFIIRTEK